MAKLLRLLLLVIALPLVYALVVEAYLVLRADIALGSIRWFLLGFIPTFFVYLLLTLDPSPTIQFINTFRHEMTHAFVSLLFFQFPHVFSIDLREWLRQRRARRRTATQPAMHRRRSARRLTLNQIHVGETGPARGDFLGTLAPYYLPLFTLPLLLLRPIAPGSLVKIVDLLIGVTYAFHLVTALREFGLHQTDVTRTGVIFSYAFVLTMHIVLLLIILLIVSGDYAGIAAYFRAAWVRAQAAYAATLPWLTTTLLPALRRLWDDVRPA